MNMDLNEQQIDIKVYSNNATPAPEHETLNPSSIPPQPKKRRALTSLLTFEMVLPSIYMNGQCAPTLMIHFLLFVCALSCFFFHFTDSFHGPASAIYYGFVTPSWPSRMMEGSPIAFPLGRESFLLMVGIVCSGLVLIFPTFRRGIGWM
ncbi:hypothetical protein glysoja_042747 [Glycine soja]|uniref:Uncharacterized protein n=1 Tax=Glycine soja TaxID=3848 RepID=A0A0B2Q035_GLYSO|nr:hypothetical protein glysoja_042747 [Glycine soja]